MFEFNGQRRPPFADEPEDGQESVWDYPRPPAIRPDSRHIEVRSDDGVIVDTSRSVRICETASPPTYYFHPDDVNHELLVSTPGRSFCEWKGAAEYWALASRPDFAVAWSYPSPSARFSDYAGHLAFYPDRVQCFIDGERVRPQPGGFYGGWVSSHIAGPWKGEPGTGHW